MVKYYVHDGCTKIVPRFAVLCELQAMLRDLSSEARADMRASGMKHAIYAIKQYDEDGALAQVDIYRPAVVLDDEEFERRTTAQYRKTPGCLILAVHE